ncbi:phosphoglucomutase/phosphomannomutase family protein [Candidatus Aerophobetes bacterium]|uniref:Phosphoglucomutase/phosphomannomutase family protein n=1 Tax=Aerophobetes bacterium TaxID=2030807 RepID=A0A523URX8_UNCAE|nr:MAG: phosphoglucomutase/phosphomannomutase family protein [Candidatus Aerophobetes bacterium]
MGEIKFGTDGWRAVIAQDFTFANVARVAQAVADYYKGKEGEKKLVVGYDTRFLSREFAELVAEVLTANDLPVILSAEDLPTQCISFAIQSEKLAGGVMVTASHNPPKFNGIKIRESFGGSAPSEVTRQIEALLDKREIKRVPLEEAEKKGLLKRKDIIEAYLKKVRSFLDQDLIEKSRLKVIHDPMFGVGDGLIEKILAPSRCQVLTIHPKYNPGFGGLAPEPIERNLEALKIKVKEEKADLGLATDGDADRAGVVSDKGEYLTPHQVFSLLLLYLVEGRGLRGGVAKTVSLGYQPERIAEDFGLSLYEVPVGFKYVCDKMLEKDILFGGEESGGYGYRGHLMERDGILSCLLFVEMLTRLQKPLSRILKEMEARFGASFFKRVDFEKSVVDKEKMIRTLSLSSPSSLGGVPVREVKTLDGIKFVMDDKSWLLIRPSGTEPKVRVYAEAPGEAELKKIMDQGVKMAQEAI